MDQKYSVAIAVPFYNHSDQFEKFFQNLVQTGLTVVVSDDGSDKLHSKKVKKICSENNFSYIKNDINRGKGHALLQAIKWAKFNNYTHVVQIDADGQHNLDDLDLFIQKSKSASHSIICGIPVYDRSVPKLRFLGHLFTNFWTHIETLDFHTIKDAMCGYRIYPIEETLLLFSNLYFMRMGFDIEILVKACWKKIDIINQPTRVIYPKGGLSHFSPIRDNLGIFLLHSYLVFASVFQWLKKRRCIKKIKKSCDLAQI